MKRGFYYIDSSLSLKIECTNYATFFYLLLLLNIVTCVWYIHYLKWWDIKFWFEIPQYIHEFFCNFFFSWLQKVFEGEKWCFNESSKYGKAMFCPWYGFQMKPLKAWYPPKVNYTVWITTVVDWSHLIILSFLTEIIFPGKVILSFLLKTSEIFQFKNWFLQLRTG